MKKTLRQEVVDLRRQVSDLTEQIRALSGTVDRLVHTLSIELTAEMIAANELSALENLETKRKLDESNRELRSTRQKAFLDTGNAYYD